GNQPGTHRARRSGPEAFVRTGRQHSQMNAMLLPKRAGRSAVLLALAAVLAACASGPTENISLIPAQTAEQTSKDGLFTQPIKWERSKPGCKGECPKLELDSIIFPGVPRLTELIDHALATMTDIAGNSA